MLNFPSLKFSCLFQKVSKVVGNSNSTQVWQQYLRCNYTKFQLKYRFSLGMCLIFKEYPNFCHFYYRKDREWNGTFTQICEALWKIYQYKWNPAHGERKHCCYFAESLMEKSLFSKMLWQIKHGCSYINSMGKFSVGLNLFWPVYLDFNILNRYFCKEVVPD